MPRQMSLRAARAPIIIAALCVLAMPTGLVAQQFVVRGVVRDAQTDSALRSVTIETAWDDIIGIPHAPTTTDTAGRFELRLDRRGPLVLSVRRLGYQPQQVTADMMRDTTSVLVRLVRTTQQLPTVTVVEKAVELFVDSMQKELRRYDHVRYYDTKALVKSNQTHAGAFLFGQGGMQSVSCGRSALYLPKGTVRTVPVENEPADMWVPCVLAQGKPRSVMVRIDGGDPQPFASISQRELDQFAAIAVISGRLILAFTKSYATTHAPR